MNEALEEAAQDAGWTPRQIEYARVMCERSRIRLIERTLQQVAADGVASGAPPIAIEYVQGRMLAFVLAAE